jgi:hypothetical protein
VRNRVCKPYALQILFLYVTKNPNIGVSEIWIILDNDEASIQEFQNYKNQKIITSKKSENFSLVDNEFS